MVLEEPTSKKKNKGKKKGRKKKDSVPTAAPTPAPTAAPNCVPTAAPTPVPTAAPNCVPTAAFLQAHAQEYKVLRRFLLMMPAFCQSEQDLFVYGGQGIAALAGKTWDDYVYQKQSYALRWGQLIMGYDGLSVYCAIALNVTLQTQLLQVG